MELYHLLNRGVDKRTIFLDTQDYARFVQGMFEFNSSHPVPNIKRNSSFSAPSPSLGGFDPKAATRGFEQEMARIVDIHGWCLMKNHYHLLVSERKEGGLTQFIRKLNIGYAKYFNEKYKRSGTLFQSRTKKVHINSDAHFLHILNYVHLNPLDYVNDAADWRERKITGHEQALDYLKEYKWSSYKDYIGSKNFPSILTTELFKEVFGDYEKEVREYLRDIETESIRPFMLE